MRVAVFAEGPEAQEALAAGADVVGADDLVDRIKDSEFIVSQNSQMQTPLEWNGSTYIFIAKFHFLLCLMMLL